MARKNEVEIDSDRSEKTREFIKQNWPSALVIAGAAGAIGAAVWLTARYLREKKQREVKMDSALEVAENEVRQATDPSATLLETGTYLGQVVGQEANHAASELANNTEDGEARDALQILAHVTKMETKK